ncbi:hypothetical protein [Mangrovicoccus sp. HB161399]|uniref:hypothetical protein n=1 Tax=Mangrovicoccus sp. HB161399 TaxID=2720392 RepID=UPI001556CF91|nr:hypothetical protein [Mangrovicoccus sp. HB161399]
MLRPDASPELADLEIRRLRQVGPGLLEVDVSLLLKTGAGLQARNLTLAVSEGGGGTLRDRLRDEARLMLGAAMRMEKFCYEAMSLADRQVRPSAA